MADMKISAVTGSRMFPTFFVDTSCIYNKEGTDLPPPHLQAPSQLEGLHVVLVIWQQPFGNIRDPISHDIHRATYRCYPPVLEQTKWFWLAQNHHWLPLLLEHQAPPYYPPSLEALQLCCIGRPPWAVSTCALVPPSATAGTTS